MERDGNPMRIKKIEESLIEKFFTLELNTPKPPKGGFFPDDLNPPPGGQGGENSGGQGGEINETKINYKNFRMESYAALLHYASGNNTYSL